MGKIRATKVKSMKALKSSLKKGSGGSYLQRVKDEGLTVRFLTEPDEWIEYYEYFDEGENMFLPVVEGVTLPMDSKSGEQVKPSKRFLANAVDTSDNRVIPLVLPKSLAQSLMRFYDKWDTLMDRDYELTREGSGYETTYAALPESVRKMKLDKFDLLDLMASLEAQVESDDLDDDDDDLADVPVPKTKTTRGTRTSGTASKGIAKKPIPVAKRPVAKKPQGIVKKSLGKH